MAIQLANDQGEGRIRVNRRREGATKVSIIYYNDLLERSNERTNERSIERTRRTTDICFHFFCFGLAKSGYQFRIVPRMGLHPGKPFFENSLGVGFEGVFSFCDERWYGYLEVTYSCHDSVVVMIRCFFYYFRNTPRSLHDRARDGRTMRSFYSSMGKDRGKLACHGLRGGLLSCFP
jgi:hypothetical protein